MKSLGRRGVTASALVKDGIGLSAGQGTIASPADEVEINFRVVGMTTWWLGVGVRIGCLEIVATTLPLTRLDPEALVRVP
jgi:hypothetical protein